MVVFFTSSRLLTFVATRGALLLMLLLSPAIGWGQNLTYTWIGSGGNSSWSNAQNWAPSRTVIAATDILVFDPLATPVPLRQALRLIWTLVVMKQ